MTSSSSNPLGKSWVYDIIKEDEDDKNLKICTLCGSNSKPIKCGSKTKCSIVNLSYHLFKHHPYEAWQAKTKHLQDALRHQELDQARHH